jgi:cation diffusion facilitator family transporter
MSSARPAGAGGMTKSRAAAVSIASNSALIALKLAAAAVTGSVAILSEALHSMIDLIASVVAFVSVRKADEPADVDHPYGHEKVENVGAAIEAMLILVGAGVIVYEAANRLSSGAAVDQLGLGIAVIAFSGLANVGVSRFLSRQAKRQNSPALAGDAAHLGTDAFTSAGVLLGLLVV